MGSRERRAIGLREEAKRFREEAEQTLEESVWDRDPIKQYVRRVGWLAPVQRFVERRRAAGLQAPLRYLTLPGRNATDIGFLWRAGLLERTDEGFPGVAICDVASAELVVTRIGDVLAYSSRNLHEAVTISSGNLVPAFPFDVINLDLTHPIIGGSARRSQALRNYFALRSVLRLQRGQSFILLLTALTDNQATAYLLPVLENNLANQPRFLTAYRDRYGTVETQACLREHLFFTQLIVPKIVAQLARDQGYAVTEEFVGHYGRIAKGGTQYPLICHSFAFDPLGRKGALRYQPRWKEVHDDDLGRDFSRRVRETAGRSYDSFLPELLRRQVVDVAAVVAGDETLRRNLTQEANELMGWWETPQ